MGLLRLLAVGAAGAVAYRLWKQRQDQAGTTGYDAQGHDGQPHGDPLIGAATASWEPEPPVSASQSSRGFGGT